MACTGPDDRLWVIFKFEARCTPMRPPSALEAGVTDTSKSSLPRCTPSTIDCWALLLWQSTAAKSTDVLAPNSRKMGYHQTLIVA